MFIEIRCFKMIIVFSQQKSFIKYAKVFPFSQTLGFKVPSKWYRRTVGVLETLCGVALVFLPGMFIRANYYVSQARKHQQSYLFF